MCQNLITAINEFGYDVDVLKIPLRGTPLKAVYKNIKLWESFCCDDASLENTDLMICLKFPSYFFPCKNKILWLTHQHRTIYDLFNTIYGERNLSKRNNALRKRIISKDTLAITSCNKIFTISKTISNRLYKFNGINSKWLYQPPAMEHAFSPGPIFPYIFCPSRLEAHKRQNLLIQAMCYVKYPIKAIISGVGPLYSTYSNLIETLNLKNKVRLTGRIPFEELLCLYKSSLAVFFAPYDEDYGFITLEAMLSGKPVITCKDSGGPTEFIVHNETGFILDPNPKLIAQKINYLWDNQKTAKKIGNQSLEYYYSLGLNWTKIVNNLVHQE